MPHKPALSITLPRSFSFHYTDSAAPITPAAQLQEMTGHTAEPPPPPRQLFKVRRRKADSAPRSNIMSDIASSDQLPSFEMTEPDPQPSPDSEPEFVSGYLAPAASRLPALAPPKTPVDQITEYTLDNKHVDWFSSRHDCFNRPVSPWSSLSDSSISSHDSDDYFPVLHAGPEDPHSPESDNNDPFASTNPVFSPNLDNNSPSAKRIKMRKSPKWTQEMDNHLWETYLQYLEMPAMTPFKTLPGTAPPLGVCERVARQAKHSWKLRRPQIDHSADISSLRALTWSHWPSSESGTRKRFRKLCRRENTIPAHYQRLMKTRTPSPFQSSSPRSRSDAQPSSFQANIAAAMPSEPPPEQPAPLTSEMGGPFDFSGAMNPTPGRGHFRARSQAHKRTQSLQVALGGRSDFSYHDRHHSTGLPSSAGNTFPRSETVPALKSPLELHAPMPSSRSLKRRFGILDDSPANVTRLENLFSETAVGANNTSAPVRSRAFTLSSVFDTTNRLSLSCDDPADNAPRINGRPIRLPPSMRLQPLAEDQARLGSPLPTPGGQGTHFNTFPRHAQLGTETPPHDFRPNFSLEGRFRELAAQNARRQ